MSIWGKFGVTLALSLAAAGLTSLLAVWAHRRSTRAYVAARPQSRPSRALLSRWSDGVVFGLWLAYVGLFGALSCREHLAFNTAGYDLGTFDQVLWNSLRGRLFETSIQTLASPYPLASYLGIHFEPLLLAVVPLYGLWSDPLLLQLINVVALSATVFPIYWSAREYLGRPWALVLAVAFLLSPAVEYATLFGFHEFALAMPLLALAIYFWLKQRLAPFLVCAGLALLVREDLALLVAAFGALAFFQSRRRLGLAVGLVGCAWLVVTVQYLIPYFAGQSSSFFFGFLYPALGDSPANILETVRTHPEVVIELLAAPDKLEFVLHLLVPLAFVSLMGLEVTVLAVPTLLTLLLSSRGPEYSIHYHYSVPLIPFLFFGAILGLRRLREATCRRQGFATPVRREALTVGGCALILVASVLSSYLQGPAPWARHFDANEFAVDSDRAALAHRIMAFIPPDAAVLTEEGFVPHLSHRRQVYQAPLILDVQQAEFAFADTTQASYELNREYWEELLRTGVFELVAQDRGFLLVKQRTLQQPVAAE